MQLQDVAAATARWQAGEIGDAAYAGLYFLHWQAARHGRRFASRRRRADPKPDPDAWLADTAALAGAQVDEYLRVYFGRYQFFGVINNVPEALAAWLAGDWPLTLCAHIPSPAQVLAMQVDGTRPVTLLSAWPRMLAPVLGKPDAFAFMVHDLEHAYKFFHDPGMHREQRAFFRLLQDAREAGRFAVYLDDPLFAAKFDYVSSDMNTHTLHAAQYLRAIVVEHHLRRAARQSPDELPPSSRAEISALMSALLGADWAADVERRMMPRPGLAGHPLNTVD
ncbi:MAG: hypothetical protein ACKN9T_03200 [Candidatus Methylumidiphilus sp.]